MRPTLDFFLMAKQHLQGQLVKDKITVYELSKNLTNLTVLKFIHFFSADFERTKKCSIRLHVFYVRYAFTSQIIKRF